ncbi:MAG TPA: hypothetical protein VGR26_10780 [Acidimicrobiales bacterium]|nr:hypothetical protein [Acidimicrobiales bacterium]
MIHDAQITEAEFPVKARYGHSAVDYAVGLAEAPGANHLLLFHHDPSRTDVQLDIIVKSLAGCRVPLSAASEGMMLSLCRRALPAAMVPRTLPRGLRS